MLPKASPYRKGSVYVVPAWIPVKESLRPAAGKPEPYLEIRRKPVGVDRPEPPEDLNEIPFIAVTEIIPGIVLCNARLH